MTLKINDTLSLPDALVTDTVAILAKRGMGKSNAAVVLAEEMSRIGAQWVAIDPKGDWWGIRSSSDGKGPGLPVPVFGGRHGDLPLEPTAGALMARLVIERNLTVVLDVSTFTKGEQIRFVTDFAVALFRLIGDDPRPLHLFLEEAEEFLPQRVDTRAAQMVGACSKIAKQGRTFGLGVTLVTQRSASLNKDALSQTDTLILFRTTSPHDRKAVEAWAEHHGERKEVAESLAELQPGESWIMSPGFLGSIERVKWRRRSTFDSGATPVAGAKPRTPSTLADIDLGEIKDLMSETIERAKADDPKELKARVRRLEKQLAEQRPEPERIVETVEVPVVPDELIDCLTNVRGAFELATRDVIDAITQILANLPVPPPAPPARPAPAAARPRPAVHHAPPSSVPISRPLGPLPGGVPGKLAQVLAEHPDGCPKGRAAMLVGVSQKKSTLRNAVSALRTGGWLTDSADPLVLTDEGLAAMADHVQPLPTGAELLEHFRRQVGGADSAPRRAFDALVAAWPDPLTSDELSELAGIERGTSTLRNAMSKLSTLGLCESQRGVYRADDDLMEAIGP